MCFNDSQKIPFLKPLTHNFCNITTTVEFEFNGIFMKFC